MKQNGAKSINFSHEMLAPNIMIILKSKHLSAMEEFLILQCQVLFEVSCTAYRSVQGLPFCPIYIDVDF